MAFRRLVSRLGPTSVLAAVAAVGPAFGLVLLGFIPNLGPWLRQEGMGGIVLYVAAFWVLGGIALIPTYAQSALGGWAFGFPVGLAAAVVSFTGASLVSHEISRRVSGDRALQIIAENARWQAVYDALLGGSFRKTFWIILLIRLPAAPFALTNVILAAARVRRVPFLLATLLGLAPRTALVVYTAAGAKELDLREPAALLTFGLSLGAMGVVVLILGLVARRTLRRITR